MPEVSWGMVVALGSSGIVMGLMSCLVGMRPRVENPLWWLVYAAWVTIVVMSGNTTPFRTVLFASVIAGLLHGVTSSLLMDQYVQNNPWHADRMQGSKSKIGAMFIFAGAVLGAVFGAIVGGVAFWLSK